MTTTSFNRNRRGPSAGTVVSVVFVVLMFLVVALWRAQAAGIFWHMAQPLVLWRNSLGQSEVAALQAQLASTTLALADRDALYQENVALKAQLGRTLSGPSVLAGVIMWPPGTPYDTLLVDAGSKEGVSLNDAVYGGGTAQLGTVSAVYEDTARVSLLSSPGSAYQAVLDGTTPLNLQGQGDGSMSGELPVSTPVAVGDPVTVPGIGGGFVGAVSYIDAPQGGSFKTVYVQLPANVFSLQFVEIHTSQ